MAQRTFDFNVNDRFWYHGKFYEVVEVGAQLGSQDDMKVMDFEAEERDRAIQPMNQAMVSGVMALRKAFKVPNVSFKVHERRLVLPQRHDGTDYGTEQAVVFLALHKGQIRQLLYFFSAKHYVSRGDSEHHGAHLAVHGPFTSRNEFDRDITEAYPTLKGEEKGIRLSKGLIAKHRAAICEALNIPLMPIEEYYTPNKTVLIIPQGEEVAAIPNGYMAPEKEKPAPRAASEVAESGRSQYYQDDLPDMSDMLAGVQRKLNRLDSDRASALAALVDTLVMIHQENPALAKKALNLSAPWLISNVDMAHWVGARFKERIASLTPEAE